MLIRHGGIVTLAALNMAVNTAVGLMVLLHCPYVRRLLQVRWPDFLRYKLDLKPQEKGEQPHEKTLD